MLATKLLLIEGLPGSGKSTTAHFIARQLRCHGVVARWYYEQESPHPLRLPAGDDPAQYAASSLRAWRSFADHARHADELTIFESSFFQGSILTLLMQDAPLATIEAYAAARQAAIAELHPALIYFHHADAAAALRWICSVRGNDWQAYATAVLADNAYSRRMGWHGLSGAIAFAGEYQALCAALVAGFSGPTLVLHAGTTTWIDTYNHILAFLDLPLVPDPLIAPEAVRQLIGTYRDEPGDFTCSVRFEAGQLMIDQVWWPADQFTPLIPKTATEFELMGTPIELTFTQAADGSIHLSIGGRSCVGSSGIGKTLCKQP